MVFLGRNINVSLVKVMSNGRHAWRFSNRELLICESAFIMMLLWIFLFTINTHILSLNIIWCLKRTLLSHLCLWKFHLRWLTLSIIIKSGFSLINWFNVCSTNILGKKIRVSMVILMWRQWLLLRTLTIVVTGHSLVILSLKMLILLVIPSCHTCTAFITLFSIIFLSSPEVSCLPTTIIVLLEPLWCMCLGASALSILPLSTVTSWLMIVHFLE